MCDVSCAHKPETRRHAPFAGLWNNEQRSQLTDISAEIGHGRTEQKVTYIKCRYQKTNRQVFLSPLHTRPIKSSGHMACCMEGAFHCPGAQAHTGGVWTGALVDETEPFHVCVCNFWGFSAGWGDWGTKWPWHLGGTLAPRWYAHGITTPRCQRSRLLF